MCWGLGLVLWLWGGLWPSGGSWSCCLKPGARAGFCVFWAGAVAWGSSKAIASAWGWVGSVALGCGLELVLMLELLPGLGAGLDLLPASVALGGGLELNTSR